MKDHLPIIMMKVIYVIQNQYAHVDYTDERT